MQSKESCTINAKGKNCGGGGESGVESERERERMREREKARKLSLTTYYCRVREIFRYYR